MPRHIHSVLALASLLATFLFQQFPVSAQVPVPTASAPTASVPTASVQAATAQSTSAQPTPAQAVQTLDFVDEAVRAPFTTDREGLQSGGLSFDLVTEIGRRLGLATTLEALPLARILALVQIGSKVGMVAVPRDAEREKFLEFSDSLLERKGFMYAQFPKAAGMKVASLTDLKGLTVGTVKGASYGADFEAAVSAGGIRLDGSADLESAFRKLAEGRVDVVLAVNLAAAEILRLPEFSGKFATIGLPYQSTPLAIGIGRSSPALDQLPRINEAIAAMKADGSLKKILAKYGL